MGKQSVDYNEQNLQAIEAAVTELRMAQDLMALCIMNPEGNSFKDWRDASCNYLAAAEALENAVKCLISPEAIADPDDIEVEQIQKGTRERPGVEDDREEENLA